MYAETFLNALDLERLQNVLENPKEVRGKGKTMSFIARMVGEAYTGEDFRNMYIGENEYFCKIIMYDFLTILRAYYIPAYPIHKHYVIVKHDQHKSRFDFRSIRSFAYHTMKGTCLDNLWVDLVPETMHAPENREFLSRTYATLKTENK